METTKQPYELLVRWDQDGKLSGAQMQHRYVIRDGAKIVGESVGNAEALDLSKGFPVQDVLTSAQADALATAEAAKARAAELASALQEMTSQRDAIKAHAAERIAELRREIEEMRRASAKASTVDVREKARADVRAHMAAKAEAAKRMS